jgi:CheY-like chemotaxis protein
MVIDNDQKIRKLLTALLTNEGWQVFSDEYTHVDLAAVQHLNPDLIVLGFDPRLEGVDWTFLQRLKMEDSTAAIPVLIYTPAMNLSPETEGYLASQHIDVVRHTSDFESFILVVRQSLNLAGQVETPVTGALASPILVVEDDRSVRKALTAVLRLEGYRVVTAANGRLALDAVVRRQHCLILLDIRMPVLNGLEFLSAYEQRPGPHTPVVICSGDADSGVQTLPSFVIGMLPKPYDISRLLALVSQYAQPV